MAIATFQMTFISFVRVASTIFTRLLALALQRNVTEGVASIAYERPPRLLVSLNSQSVAMKRDFWFVPRKEPLLLLPACYLNNYRAVILVLLLSSEWLGVHNLHIVLLP